MSSLLSAELAATCNAIGYFDSQTNKYYADGNTLETVKDLIRYLRRDDESYDIRRQLGETRIVQTDLIPLLKSYWEQTDLLDALVRANNPYLFIPKPTCKNSMTDGIHTIRTPFAQK